MLATLSRTVLMAAKTYFGLETMANVLRARLARRMMEQQGTITVRGANAIH